MEQLETEKEKLINSLIEDLFKTQEMSKIIDDLIERKISYHLSSNYQSIIAKVVEAKIRKISEPIIEEKTKELEPKIKQTLEKTISKALDFLEKDFWNLVRNQYYKNSRFDGKNLIDILIDEINDLKLREKNGKT